MNILLRQLSQNIHEKVHETPNETHGFDKQDVLNAAALLHNIVIDYSSRMRITTDGQKEAEYKAYAWGASLHDQILKMTEIDTHKL